MHRALLWIGLLLFLAGCVAPPGESGSDEDEPETTPAFLTYRGCHEHQGVFLHPAADFESYLPDGFSLSTVGESLAQWTLVAYHCDHVLGEAFEATDAGEMFGALLVQPPAALRIDNGSRVGGYTIPLFHVSTDDRVSATYETWGWGDTAVGAVRITNDVDEPALRVGLATLAADTVGLEARTVAAGTAEAWEGRFVRTFGLDAPFGQPGTPRVVGYTDAWVPDRAARPQGSMSYSGFHGDGFPGSLLPSASTGVGIHWDMAPDAVAYHAQFTPLAPA